MGTVHDSRLHLYLVQACAHEFRDIPLSPVLDAGLGGGKEAREGPEINYLTCIRITARDQMWW